MNIELRRIDSGRPTPRAGRLDGLKRALLGTPQVGIVAEVTDGSSRRGSSTPPGQGGCGLDVVSLTEVEGESSVLVDLAGAGLANLSRRQRRALLLAALVAPKRIEVRWRMPLVVAHVFMALAAPQRQLIEFYRQDLPVPSVGLIDVEGRGVATLEGTQTTATRIHQHGVYGPAEVLNGLVQEWRDAGRPDIGDLRVSVRYGRNSPNTHWRVLRRGDARISFDWNRVSV